MATVLESLNAALHAAFAFDSSVILLGEDVLDPYGGAFKVTRGLSSSYPERVLTTPISEAGIVGVAAGMAMRGLRPIVEIMFGDFLTLCADQLVNHAAKFRWMYNDQVRVPLIVRTPMGGRRGYGPTHSQTLEKLFFGVPGLRILAPSAFGDPGDLLRRVILECEDPVLFIENKLLYALPLTQHDNLPDFIFRTWDSDFTGLEQVSISSITEQPAAPAYFLSIQGAPPPSLTIAAYGYMAELARQAALILAYEWEIFTELVVPSQLAPFQLAPVLESVRRTNCLLVVEEGTLTAGWGAEILARSAESRDLKPGNFRRLAARDLPVPAATTLENEQLPGIDDIIRAARGMF